MKTSLIVLALVGQSYLASAQMFKQEPFLNKSLAGLGIKEVFVNTSGGSITVSGDASERPRVEVYVSSNNGMPITKEEAKRRLEENYILEVEARDGELRASAKSKRKFNWNNNNSVNISFKVYVPEKANTNLSTSGGSIHLDHLTGNESFSTSGGSLHLDHIAGNIKGRTSGGSIHVSDSRQDIDLSTSGGSIDADNCDGRMRLETSGGSLNLNHLKGDIRANTSGGSIHADGINGDLVTSTSGGSINLTDLAGSVDASTSGGSLHAQFREVRKSVRLSVSAGHIDLTLPAKQGLDLDLSGQRVSNESLNNFSGEHDKDRIRGKVNGGGALVRADANSGRLNVNFN